MDKDQLVKLLRGYKDPIDAMGIRMELESKLSTPFFRYQGPVSDPGVESVVQRCWYEIQRAHEVTHGPNPKTYLQVLLQIAERWGKEGDNILLSPAERALFSYNEALVNSLVLEAVSGQKG